MVGFAPSINCLGFIAFEFTDGFLVCYFITIEMRCFNFHCFHLISLNWLLLLVKCFLASFHHQETLRQGRIILMTNNSNSKSVATIVSPQPLILVGGMLIETTLYKHYKYY